MPRLTGEPRHLRWTAFEARIRTGLPSVESLRGTPRVHLVIEPGGKRIGARFYSEEQFRIPNQLAEVLVRAIGVGSNTALEITTGNEDLFCDFYALCCQIADRVQIEHHSVSTAVNDTLSSWGALISKRRLIDENSQVGLLGELLFLTKAARALGWDRAAQSWYGPCSEEHDFALPSVDAEVKSTTSERRVHEISSLTQLLPKSGRPLFLVSVQLTPSEASSNSFSLAEMIARVLAAAAKKSPQAADRIRQQLTLLGWSDDDATYYTRRFSLRTPICAAHVDESFPALVPATIGQSSQGSDLARFERVSYAINVDGLGFTEESRQFNRLF